MDCAGLLGVAMPFIHRCPQPVLQHSWPNGHAESLLHCSTHRPNPVDGGGQDAGGRTVRGGRVRGGRVRRGTVVVAEPQSAVTSLPLASKNSALQPPQ